MAHLEGTNAGLVPYELEKPKREKPAEILTIPHCDACGGVIQSNKKTRQPRSIDGWCLHCVKMFGRDSVALRGVTNLEPADASKRMELLRESQWGLVLRRGSFGLPDGRMLTIEPGDIFKIARAGRVTTDEDEVCTWDRTRLMFSAEISIVGMPLLLWPHEVSGISLMSVMAMKKTGEIEECFMSTEDENGYFKPTDSVREMIYAVFGRMVNAPDVADPSEGRYGPKKSRSKADANI